MTDFDTLQVEVVAARTKKSLPFRDQGHGETLKRTYALVRPRNGALNPGVPVEHVWQTGILYLETKRALEENRTIIIESGAQPGS
jgi:hypothetical protein